MNALGQQLVLLLVLSASPLLLARSICRSWQKRCIAAALLATALPLAVMLLLQAMRIPLHRDTLLLGHLPLLLLSLTITLCTWNRKGTWPAISPPLLLATLLLLLMLFPWTTLTGIDTYKWQDLATAIRMEASIPWLVHPVSLLGFTPRAYPPLQPALLATIQIVGNLGVEGGFRILSVLNILIALASATACFSRRPIAKAAFPAALLYAASPVFVRYTHWATGRGLFLALLPAALYFLLPPCPQPTGTPPRKRRMLTATASALGFCLAALLLLMSHKVALVAVPILLAASVGNRLIPRNPLKRTALLLPFAMAALLLVAPAWLPGIPGALAGIFRTSLTRYAWMLPLAALAWIFPRPDRHTATNIIDCLFLLTLPLAFDPQMYGALLALPAICLLATAQTLRIWQSFPRQHPASLYAALALALIPALIVVAHRSRTATPPDVKAAALFLEKHDPQGPFLIHAPDPLRTRIQAYVSGSPRFTLQSNAPDPPSIQKISPPPPLFPLNSQSPARWSRWLRNLITLDHLDVSWYGNPQRHYHIVPIPHPPPPGTRPIYQNHSLQIFAREE